MNFLVKIQPLKVYEWIFTHLQVCGIRTLASPVRGGKGLSDPPPPPQWRDGEMSPVSHVSSRRAFADRNGNTALECGTRPESLRKAQGAAVGGGGGFPVPALLFVSLTLALSLSLALPLSSLTLSIVLSRTRPCVRVEP